MKKYLLFLIILLTSCSNIDKKEHYYNNSIKLNVVFNKNMGSFKKAYLRINLWSENKEILDEKYIYDLAHTFGNTNNKRILVNFKNLDKNKNNKITVELFADINSDEIIENYVGILRENSDESEYTFDLR